MNVYQRWFLGAAVGVIVVASPVVYFRWAYAHNKRFREVDPGHFYRSGEMTAHGFAQAVTLHHIRTIVNLQDEYPDPELYQDYFSGRRIRESELCRRLGVRYVYIPPDLIPRCRAATQRPVAIERFLDLLDDPANYPILAHCRAGLHRTGVMVGVYRMEKNGWSPQQAIEELKANGFGEWPCTAANDYITQYILTYRRGLRNTKPIAHSP
jgi:protein tyrosine phosphatase (PTP) superfamily phosphohydrolase (DUF442 family)